MKKYILLLLLFIASIGAGYGQLNKERQIEIFASASIDGTEFFIKITPGPDSTKMTFKIRDSISVNLNNDKAYHTHRNYLLSLNSIDLKNDTVIKYLSIVKSITEQYTFYSEDSIEIVNAAHKGYLHLINEVFNSTTDRLENKNRFVMDGIFMSFTLTDKDSTRKVNAFYPTEESNKMLYELVTGSTSIYRLTKKNNFLDKRKLFGY
jgi:hypothetical protein